MKIQVISETNIFMCRIQTDKLLQQRTEMRERARVPVLTRAGSVRRLDARAQALFVLESRAADLYSLAYPDLREAQGGRAWKDGPVMI